MKLRLSLDEDVHFVLAESLRKRKYDTLYVQETERKGKGDIEQLDFSVFQKRCFVTFNVKDFVILHNEYVSKQRHVSDALRLLLRKIAGVKAGDMKNRLEFL